MQKLKSWRKGGTTDFAHWQIGVPLKAIQSIVVGDILFQDSEQFDALNLCRITRIDMERGICYATFVHPADTKVGRMGTGSEPEFAIWDHEFVKSHHEYFTAVPNKELLAMATSQSMLRKPRALFKRLTPLVDKSFREAFSGIVGRLKRPYYRISEAEYNSIMKLANGSDVVLFDGKTQLTFGEADGGYALMPLIRPI